MKTHWKYILVSFLIGAFLGSASALVWEKSLRHRGYSSRPYERMREQLFKELDLNTEQRARVSAIMQDTREKMRAIRTSAQTDIRNHLYPEQQAKYDALIARRKARWDRTKSEKP